MNTTDRYRVLTTAPFGPDGTCDGSLLRTDDTGPEPTPIMYGYFARYDAWNEIRSYIEGHFMERVAPGAFDDSFRASTPKPIFDHGHDPSIGMKPIGQTTVLRADQHGQYYEAELFDSVPDLVLDGLRAGAYGASYRFAIEEEQVDERPGRSDHNPDGIPEVTIVRASVKEFGPTAFGADPQASAAVRSATDYYCSAPPLPVVGESEGWSPETRITSAAAAGLKASGSERDATTADADPAAAHRAAYLRSLHLKEIRDA